MIISLALNKEEQEVVVSTFDKIVENCIGVCTKCNEKEDRPLKFMH